MVAFLSAFVAVIIVLCGLLALAYSVGDRWQVFSEHLGVLAQEVANRPDENQSGYTDTFVGFREGIVFAVGYPENGNFRENEGICPDESQIAWLREFKEAIAACGAQTNLPLRLDVQGFASIAPVASEDTDSSEADNLAIANQRGRLIARFLTNGYENLEDCDQHEEEYCASNMTTRDGDCLVEPGNYVVRHREWLDFDTMRQFSLVDDGDRPTPSRYRLEFLNRTVHIAVMNNVCWQPLSRHWTSGR